jgi:hypothetical protein
MPWANRWWRAYSQDNVTFRCTRLPPSLLGGACDAGSVARNASSLNARRFVDAQKFGHEAFSPAF